MPDAGDAAIGCEGEGALELAIVPETGVVFEHLASTCATLDTQVLLHNTSSEAIRIDSIAIAAPFSVRFADLPHELAPGATMIVKLRLHETEVAEHTGMLVVRSAQHCSMFEVLGYAVEDSLLSFSALAIDFGDVPAGTTSEPRTFEVLYQGPKERAPVTVSGFSPSPPETFRLVSTPPALQMPDDCERRTLTLELTAPEEPGPLEGSLFFESESVFEGETYFGTIAVPLFGRAVLDD